MRADGSLRFSRGSIDRFEQFDRFSSFRHRFLYQFDLFHGFGGIRSANKVNVVTHFA